MENNDQRQSDEWAGILKEIKENPPVDDLDRAKALSDEYIEKMKELGCAVVCCAAMVGDINEESVAIPGFTTANTTSVGFLIMSAMQLQTIISSRVREDN